MPAGPESYDTAGWYEASGGCSCWQPRVLIVAAGAAMVDYLSKYGSCGEFTGVDNVHIAIKSNKLSAP